MSANEAIKRLDACLDGKQSKTSDNSGATKRGNMKTTNAGMMMKDSRTPQKAQPKGATMKIHQRIEPSNEITPTALSLRIIRKEANAPSRTTFNVERALSAMEDAFDQLTILQEAICDLAKAMDGTPQSGMYGQIDDSRDNINYLGSCLYGIGDILIGVWADLEAEAEPRRK